MYFREDAMIINMAVNATEEQIDHVVKRIQECGFQAHLSRGEERVELGKGVSLGGTEIVAAAGPCAVESAAQIGEIAEKVARAGAKLLRGGAFKPRSSPYSFQGLGEE